VSKEPEIDALEKVYDALKDLEADAQRRVITWTCEKLELAFAPGGMSPGEGPSKPTRNLSDFSSVADAFTAAGSPQKTEDKVLVVAAFLQTRKEDSEVTGGEINKELKNMGHRVKNITSAIEALIRKKPQLMIQTKKAGKTKQARKKYKVTDEGFAAVNQMINKGTKFKSENA